MSQVTLSAGMSPAQAAARLHEKMLELRLAVVEAFNLEKLHAIFDKLIERAIGGCVQSIRLALGYALGRPGAVQAAPRQERSAAALMLADAAVTKRENDGTATVTQPKSAAPATVTKRQDPAAPATANVVTTSPQPAAPALPTSIFTPAEQEQLAHGQLPDLCEASRLSVVNRRPIVNKR